MRKDITILISEDDKGHFVLVKQCLRHAGLENEIEWFIDGQGTLDYLLGENSKVQDGQKYILLLDIRMPKVNGVEVLEIMKADDKIKDIPVVMLTTSNDHEQAQRCYDLGCDAHIVKPVNEMLIKAMERCAKRL